MKYSKTQINKYRDALVDHNDWSDYIKDEFTEKMNNIGVRVDRILFTGFWSQGDGACFEGKVEDWGKYLLRHGIDNPILTEVAKESWWFEVMHTGRYYHHKSVVYDCAIYRPLSPWHYKSKNSVYEFTEADKEYLREGLSEADGLRYDAWYNTMDLFNLEYLSSIFEEDMEDHMKDLYQQLAKEYEHLTSDETLTEWMNDNDIIPHELTETEN